MLQALTYNANALLHRVNDVLDMAAIDGGQLRLQPESVHVGELVRAVHAICNAQASETKVRLVVEVADGAGVAVIGDAGRMEQALTNLVSNAIKFSPGGDVSLTVSGTTISEFDMVELRFVVADNGVGIPADQKERVFEPFRQLDQGPGRGHGGVGLGLLICALD